VKAHDDDMRVTLGFIKTEPLQKQCKAVHE